MKFKIFIVSLFLLSSSLAKSASIIMPERYDLDIQVDFFLEELSKKIADKKQLRIYVSDFTSPEKTNTYSTLNENIKSYISCFAGIKNGFSLITSKDADQKLKKLHESNKGKPVTDYQLTEIITDQFCDVIIYGYLTILNEKLVVDIKALHLNRKEIIISKYISSSEQAIATRIGIKNYAASSLLRHSLGVTFNTLFGKVNLGTEQNAINYETYEIYISYYYHFTNWISVGAQIGYDIAPFKEYLSAPSPMATYDLYKGFSPNFDLNPIINFHIPFNKVFIPVFSFGVGFSFHTIQFIEHSNIWPYTRKFADLPSTTVFLFNLKADAGFDIYFNENVALRALVNFNLTVNPYTYNKYEYTKPWISFTLGLNFRF